MRVQVAPSTVELKDLWTVYSLTRIDKKNNLIKYP